MEKPITYVQVNVPDDFKPGLPRDYYVFNDDPTLEDYKQVVLNSRMLIMYIRPDDRNEHQSKVFKELLGHKICGNLESGDRLFIVEAPENRDFHQFKKWHTKRLFDELNKPDQWWLPKP